MKLVIFEQLLGSGDIACAMLPKFTIEQAMVNLQNVEMLIKNEGYGIEKMAWVEDLDAQDTVLVPPCLN